jgi:hypothetical protein
VLSEAVQQRITTAEDAETWWVQTLACHQGQRSLRPLRHAGPAACCGRASRWPHLLARCRRFPNCGPLPGHAVTRARIGRLRGGRLSATSTMRNTWRCCGAGPPTRLLRRRARKYEGAGRPDPYWRSGMGPPIRSRRSSAGTRSRTCPRPGRANQEPPFSPGAETSVCAVCSRVRMRSC